MVAQRLGTLVAVGRLMLMIYVGHLVVLAALVRPEPHYLHEGALITVFRSAGAIVFDHAWTKRFSTGPHEDLLRVPGPSRRRLLGTRAFP